MKPPSRASTERFRVSACEGKARFASATIAHKVAKRRSERDKRGEAYHCEFCGGYHIGARSHKNAKVEKRKAFLADDPDFA